MKKFYLAIALICFANTLFSQIPPWQWAKNGGGYSTGSFAGAVPFEMVTDVSGNVYVTGWYDGLYCVVDSDTLFNASNLGNSHDIFLVKYSSTGNVLWAKTYGGTGDELGFSIALDATGNLIAAGKFSSTTITFDTITLNNPSLAENIYLVKFDAAGNVIWGKTERGNPYYLKLAADADNNIYMAGTFPDTLILDNDTLSSAGGYDIFLAKYDTDGNVGWTKRIGSTGNNDECLNVKVDNGYNVYIRGHYDSNTISFDSISLTNTSGMLYGFVAKYDSSGNVAWVKQEIPGGGGSLGVWGTGLAVDKYGNVYTTGRYDSGSITAGSYSWYNPAGATYNQVYFDKYDSSGNVLWLKGNYSGSGVNSGEIEVAADTNLYISGYFFCPSVTFGNVALTNSNISGSQDVFLVKYNTSGSFRWALNPYGHEYDYSTDLATTANNEVYICGNSRGDMQFGGTFLYSWNPNVYFYFLAKLGDVTTNVNDDVSSYKNFSLYPNPASGNFTVSINEMKSDEGKLKIFDLVGNVVYEQQIKGPSTNINCPLSPGIYFVKLIDGNIVSTQKLIIQ